MSLKKKLTQLAELNRDKEEERKEYKRIWSREVGYLYETVEDWLKEYTDSGKISIEYYQLPDEDIQCMELNLGDAIFVMLDPSGINVAGAFGKIEVYVQGHRDERVYLLLIQDDETQQEADAFHWELWKSKKENEQYAFTKDNFENLLEEWIDKWAKG